MQDFTHMYVRRALLSLIKLFYLMVFREKANIKMY